MSAGRASGTEAETGKTDMGLAHHQILGPLSFPSGALRAQRFCRVVDFTPHAPPEFLANSPFRGHSAARIFPICSHPSR